MVGEKEILEFLARNKIWADALHSLTINYNMTALTHYAKLLGYSVETLKAVFMTACQDPEYIVDVLLKHRLYVIPSKRCGINARILFKHGMPLTASTTIAGLKLAAAGGTTGLFTAIGYGKTLLTGLGYAALVGAIIIGVIMGANFIAESWGTHGADDPIERTLKGDPEERKAWEAAEQEEKQRDADTIYRAHFTATTEAGKDITNTVWSEPGIIDFGEGGSIVNFDEGNYKKMYIGKTYGELCDAYHKWRVSHSYPPSKKVTYCVHPRSGPYNNIVDCSKHFTVYCTRKGAEHNVKKPGDWYRKGEY